MVLYFIGVYIINRTLHRRLEMWNFSSRVEKIFHLFAALTHEIFFNTRREISYLRATMQYPLFICVSYCYLIRFSISSNIFSFIPIRAYLIKFISTFPVYLIPWRWTVWPSEMSSDKLVAFSFVGCLFVLFTLNRLLIENRNRLRKGNFHWPSWQFDWQCGILTSWPSWRS